MTESNTAFKVFINNNVEVKAVQWKGNNNQEVLDVTGHEPVAIFGVEGLVSLNGFPLEGGDFIIKKYRGVQVVTEEFFYEHYTTERGNPQTSKTIANNAASQIDSAITMLSNLGYSDQRDFIIYNLEKSKEALVELGEDNV